MIDRRFLGYVEVDSGTLVIGDPAYLLPRKETGREGVDYEAVIEAAGAVGPLAGMPVLLLQSFGGDGTFPVFGEYEDDDLVRVLVEFVGPEE